MRLTSLQEIVVRESKRKDPQYRQEALASLDEFVELRADRDLFTHVLEITKPTIISAMDESAEMDIDSRSGDFSSKTMCVTLPQDSEPWDANQTKHRVDTCSCALGAFAIHQSEL